MGARGAEAENLAAAFLERAGLKLIERNYRCRFGEIDVIAHDGAVLVFVEVRMRSSARFGGAAGSITAAKQMKLLRTARFYLAGVTRAPECRFDALLIDGRDNSIEWLKNAFAE